MSGALQHLGISLRLHFRNRIGLFYGYLFPLVFLVVFWVLYRHERVPLLRHMGELLTVSVLGGACFGLPTTLVSERERGVWRRYRLAPVPTWAFVTSTVVARYLIILSAGVMQLGVALAMGMTAPEHPVALWVAFTLVSFAFIGLGLVIASLADNVPAVQALGQCLFLPMLVIGGVAVSLASLPLWAQHVSAFFPGRYSVEALQAAVNGRGFSGMRFSLLALALTGVAGVVAGAKLFRWDAQQRFAAQSGKAWMVPVAAVWLAVGFFAEARGRIAIAADAERPAPVKAEVPVESPAAKPVVAVTAALPTPTPIPAPTPTPTPPPRAPAPWELITAKDVAALDFNLPPDSGVVAPMADADDQPDESSAQQLETVRRSLPDWLSANVKDDVQRVRNLLYVAAVPDSVQHPLERYLPAIVLQRLGEIYSKEKLLQLLAWIALHPNEGRVIDDVSEVGVEGQAGDPEQVRERTTFYALKFIARLTGRVPAQ